MTENLTPTPSPALLRELAALDIEAWPLVAEVYHRALAQSQREAVRSVPPARQAQVCEALDRLEAARWATPAERARRRARLDAILADGGAERQPEKRLPGIGGAA